MSRAPLRPPVLFEGRRARPAPWSGAAALPALIAALALACAGGEGGGRGGGGRGGDGADGAEAEAGPERRVLVQAAPVERGSVGDHLVTSGTLDSEAQADIVPEANGAVTQVLVEEGDQVSRGQLLAVIANPSLDANAQRADLELQRARAGFDEAERLHQGGAISEAELRDARNALRSAETSFQEAARSRGFTRVESPIAGTVTVRDVRLGEVGGGRRAFQVVDMTRLRVVVQLPEKDLPRVRVGQTVVLSGAYDEGAAASGQVARVSPVVDPSTGTVKVTIAVDPSQTALRPGQFVKARLEVDRRDGVLTVPRRALVWDDGEPVAWRIIEAPAPEPPTAEGEPTEADDAKDEAPGFFEGLFGGDGAQENAEAGDAVDRWAGIPRRGVEKARLKIGFVDQERVEVLEGLAESDQVVSAGTEGLRAEVLVKLPGDPEPPPAPEGDDEGSDGGGPGRSEG